MYHSQHTHSDMHTTPVHASKHTHTHASLIQTCIPKIIREGWRWSISMFFVCHHNMILARDRGFERLQLHDRERDCMRAIERERERGSAIAIERGAGAIV